MSRTRLQSSPLLWIFDRFALLSAVIIRWHLAIRNTWVVFSGESSSTYICNIYRGGIPSYTAGRGLKQRDEYLAPVIKSFSLSRRILPGEYPLATLGLHRIPLLQFQLSTELQRWRVGDIVGKAEDPMKHLHQSL
ncbi:hypothetical protein BJX99DRAFT_111187 [Aspergillus californicus]